MAAPETLEQLLDRIEDAGADRGRVELGTILKSVGRRSFGPLLLVAGLITLAPVIGDIPGMPTLMGVFVFLIAAQLLFRRDHFWLPHFLLARSVSHDRLRKAAGWMRRPAAFIDRITGPRLTVLVGDRGAFLVAVACILISLSMPAMELVPFSANVAGAALTAFGLALIAHDGLLALIALLFAAATFGLVGYVLI